MHGQINCKFKSLCAISLKTTLIANPIKWSNLLLIPTGPNLNVISMPLRFSHKLICCILTYS